MAVAAGTLPRSFAKPRQRIAHPMEPRIASHLEPHSAQHPNWLFGGTLSQRIERATTISVQQAPGPNLRTKQAQGGLLETARAERDRAGTSGAANYTRKASKPVGEGSEQTLTYAQG
jgi:hypothetical protein